MSQIKNLKMAEALAMTAFPGEGGVFSKQYLSRSSRGDFCKKSKSAFTLAEVLITLSIIGIVAALTIPGLVKHHNEHAWKVGKEVFQQKLEVALKSMNTQGKLSGYTTTEDFVNELKKNIKITKVCTDDVTRCFPSKVRRGKNKGFFNITNTSVEYEAKEGYDWAETVGLQFNNGVTALVAYNKNCYADPYDNQGSVMSSCIGITYDVTANTKPNTVGQDVAYNDNVKPFGCVYEMATGKCITKILAPETGYSPFPMQIGTETVTCNQAIERGLIESQRTSCTYGNNGNYDYWAGAQYACGGKKANMLTMVDLGYLAQEMYNLSDPVGAYQYINSGLTIDPTKSANFFAQSSGGTGSDPYFAVWSSVENGSGTAYTRAFFSDRTSYYDNDRNLAYRLAVCLGD